MSGTWRMAIMIDARGGDFAAMERGLAGIAGDIRGLAGVADVRLGVADKHPDLGAAAATDYAAVDMRGVDGAVEITVAEGRSSELPAIAQALSALVAPLAEPGSIEVMAGPLFAMVPQRPGGTFLSLAFRRFPGTTSQQFRDWWRFQHAGVAIPVMGPGMLAYDQVHVDAGATEALGQAMGVPVVLYDAYDNLTWADHRGFLKSTEDVEAMAGIFADEVGRIDNTSRRHALMRVIG